MLITIVNSWQWEQKNNIKTISRLPLFETCKPTCITNNNPEFMIHYIKNGMSQKLFKNTNNQ